MIDTTTTRSAVACAAAARVRHAGPARLAVTRGSFKGTTVSGVARLVRPMTTHGAPTAGPALSAGAPYPTLDVARSRCGRPPA